jgi:LysM repeat protein
MIGRRRAGTILRGLAALAVLLALVAGVPLGLLATIGNPIPDQWTWAQPLSDSALLDVLALVAWVLWAQLALCVIVEVIAEIRLATGRSADWLARVPGTFGGQQAIARTLVNAVVAIGVTSSAAAAGTPLLRAHVEPMAASVAPVVSHQVTAPSHAATSQVRDRATAEVTVTRGDTLWSIAEQHLGDGLRWREIEALNEDRVMNDGATFHSARDLHPEWVIRVPATGERGVVVTVRPGDSLSAIAQDRYGDASDWSRIYHANQREIDDPNLIYPGERLTLPPVGSPNATTRDTHDVHHGRSLAEPPVLHEPRLLPTEPVGPQTAGDRDRQPEPDRDGTDPTVIGAHHRNAEAAATSWVVGGSGGLLAASVLAAYLARRRAQGRRRRSGRAIPRTRPEHAAVESAVRSHGFEAANDVDFVDAALRDLGRAADPPDARAARLDSAGFEVVLAGKHLDPPTPWSSNRDGTRWCLARNSPIEGGDLPSIYPLMVNVGVDDNGGTWFVDLEAAGLVVVDGPTDVATDVIRFIAAELATSRWSEMCHVAGTELGPALRHINPHRFEASDDVDLEHLTKRATRIGTIRDTHGVDVLEGRAHPELGDNWSPKVIATAKSANTLDGIERFGDAVAEARRSVALIGRAPAPTDVGLRIQVDAGGRGNLPWVDGLELNRLRPDEADLLGSAFSALEDEDDEPMPIDEISEHGIIAGWADASGRLREHLLAERGEAGGPASLLPDSNEVYVDTAATTVPDLEALAAPMAEGVLSDVDPDPSLDNDVATWFSEGTDIPRLRLLGPIELMTNEPLPERAKNRVAYLTELCAYLICHPAGRTSLQLAEAFGVQAATIHKRVEELRLWLGTDPVTGDHRVPEAKLSSPGSARGVGNYVVTGIMNDADLFRRLRVRAQLRGEEGIGDLSTALNLITGEPFDQQRAGGYGWLAESGTNHHLAAAAVDVAHIVATRSLAVSDTERAFYAASQGIAVAPYEDKPRLDFAAAKAALSADPDSDMYLRREVLNRSDDECAPPDLTSRTAQLSSRIAKRADHQ